LQAVQIDIAVEIVVDHDGWCMVTRSKADDWQEGEPIVGGCFAKPYAEASLKGVTQRLVAHDPA
jgi:hypothetical protein